MGFPKWLKASSVEQPRQQKRAPRHADPAITAHYWDGGAPVARELRDISLTGAYLYTSDRWYPGTIIRLTLQPKSATEAGVDEGAITVSCKVTRHGSDGLGVRFLLQNDADRKKIERFMQDAVNVRNAQKRVNARSEGQALVEFALMLPLLLVLIINTVNFGCYLYSWITVTNAARAAAQYAALGSSSVGLPAGATPSQIAALVTNETNSLPSWSSTGSVTVCINNNGTKTVLPDNTGTAPAACPADLASALSDDPEYMSGGTYKYVNLLVDVQYTYKPLFGVFSAASFATFGFPSSGTLIDVKTTMRWL